MSSAYRKPDTWRQRRAALNGSVALREPARTTSRRRPGIGVAGPLIVIAAIAAALGYQSLASSSSLGEALPRKVWPVDGQAAFVMTGRSHVRAGPNQHAAPIASVAKVMTAYLVLRDHPLRGGEDGPSITLTDADVADTDRRRGHEESVVAVAAGEQLTERQALQALLLPSANNIAAVLARWDAGSAERFVARMNAAARSLGMTVSDAAVETEARRPPSSPRPPRALRLRARPARTSTTPIPPCSR